MSESMADRAVGADGRSLSAILLVAVFGFFWIGLTPFPDPNASGLLTPFGESSNLTNQLVVLMLAGLVLLALLQHPARGLVLRSCGMLALIVCWLLVTMPLSSSPETVIRRLVFAVLVCLCASSVLFLPRDIRQFGALTGGCIFAAVLLSWIGVFVVPGLAIHQASDALEQQLAGAWRGHFGHKNTTAAAMVYAVFFGLYLIRAKSAFYGAALTLAAFVFLLNSGSKTSVAMLPAIMGIAWVFERAGSLRLMVVVVPLALMNYILMSAALSDGFRDLLVSIGVDPTFTDRTAVWRLAIDAVAQKPVTGYGFQAFWQMDGLVYGESGDTNWAVTAANAHNGYLEQLINGGLPLLLMVLAWLVLLPARHAGLAFSRAQQPELTRLFLRCWLFALFLACLESPFFDNRGPVWFTMLIAIFGLRMLAYGNLTRSDDS